MSGTGSFIQKHQQSRVLSTSEDGKKYNDIESWESLYETAPQYDLQLEDVQVLTISRLKVLKGIEDFKCRGKGDDELQAHIRRLLAEMFPPAQPGSRVSLTNTQRDQASHYLLRLAYCQSEDLRKWLVTYECELMKYRMHENPHKLQSLLSKSSSWSSSRVSKLEISNENIESQLRAQVQATTGKGVEQGSISNGTVIFYKLPFEQVPDLVGGKRVFLKAGYAYVTANQMTSALVAHFKQSLQKALDVVHKQWQQRIVHEEQDRLAPMVQGVRNWYVGKQYGDSDNEGAVSLQDLPNLVNSHFPLCMRHMYNKGQQDRHLRHQARLQLGLFLKAIGLSLEEALLFWRDMFRPKIESDAFEKQYAYNIRHNYGKEGKRQTYSAHSCVAIISSHGGKGECHGCPYKTFQAGQLRAQLGKMGVQARAIDEIVNKASGGHYQVACTKELEARLGIEPDQGIIHPNQYFEQVQLSVKQGVKGEENTENSIQTPLQNTMTPISNKYGQNSGGGAGWKSAGSSLPPRTPTSINT